MDLYYKLRVPFATTKEGQTPLPLEELVTLIPLTILYTAHYILRYICLKLHLMYGYGNNVTGYLNQYTR
jgi:hypothetical protein